jgi:predicted metalloprotease with PDZ domain
MARAESPVGLTPIRHRVGMPDLNSHEFEVTLEVPPLPNRSEIELVFSAWAPGSYMVRDFARHIYDLVITDDRGRSVPFERLDKQRWRVSSGGRGVRAKYRVFAYEQTVRTSHLDDSHAFWNGTSLFFAIEGERERPQIVRVEAPRGWQIATALPLVKGETAAFRAASYDELVDSPFEIGTHVRESFRARGARFEVALYGRTNADVRRLVRDLERIVIAGAELFGGFPFDRYLFIIHALPARGGGLEHAASTTLDIAGLSFDDEKGYLDFAELAAHEFFHTWNVKRIRDRVLGPFDYTKENYTRLLWFHEGFTEYMESILLLRAGLLDARKYLRELGDAWAKYVTRPGRNVTPLSMLSFEAWIKLYKPADNHVNRAVSYYEKGKWAALVLELMLREATSGRAGLPELFRRLWEGYGEVGRSITDADLRAEVDALAGRSLRDYFERYIEGTEELPVLALLRRAGIEVKEKRPGEDEEDGIKRRRARGWVGVSFAPGDRAIVRNVAPGSPAWRAGLTYGDEIVAVDDVRVTQSSAPKRFADHAPGERVQVAYFRQDLLRTATVTVAEAREGTVSLQIGAKPSARARAVRRGWLGV